MSKASPGTTIGSAFVAALATALAQLGLAFGLAILIWRQDSAAEWAVHLSWAAWLTAVSTVIGSSVAARLSSEIGIRVISVLASAVGAMVVAPLIAVPAMRFTETGLATAPFAAAGIGAAAGAVISGLALASRAVSVNVTASIAVTWLLAGLAAFVPIGDERGELVRLGVWGSWRDLVPEVAPALLAASLLIGAITALIAGNASGGDHRVIAVSGAAGPLLLVAAYAAAGQPDVGVATDWTGIWIGGYAALAGLLGSLLVTALRRSPAPASSAGATPAVATATATVPAGAGLGDPVESDADTDRTYVIPAATESKPRAAAPAEPVDPYVSSDYDRYGDPEFTEFDEPEQAEPKIPHQSRDGLMPPAPKAEVPDPPAPQESSDATESWVSDLKDDNAFSEQRDAEDDGEETSKPKKKRRLGRKKKDS